VLLGHFENYYDTPVEDDDKRALPRQPRIGMRQQQKAEQKNAQKNNTRTSQEDKKHPDVELPDLDDDEVVRAKPQAPVLRGSTSGLKTSVGHKMKAAQRKNRVIQARTRKVRKQGATSPSSSSGRRQRTRTNTTANSPVKYVPRDDCVEDDEEEQSSPEKNTRV
jgi:hypothetical protein